MTLFREFLRDMPRWYTAWVLLLLAWFLFVFSEWLCALVTGAPYWISQ